MSNEFIKRKKFFDSSQKMPPTPNNINKSQSIQSYFGLKELSDLPSDIKKITGPVFKDKIDSYKSPYQDDYQTQQDSYYKNPFAFKSETEPIKNSVVMEQINKLKQEKYRHSYMEIEKTNTAFLQKKQTLNNQVFADKNKTWKNRVNNSYKKNQYQNLVLENEGTSQEKSGARKIVKETTFFERPLFKEVKKTENYYKINTKDGLLNKFDLHMPYNPYDYQVDAIQSLVTSLSLGHKTIMFESPTGTGKTQTILTSFLGFMQKDSSTYSGEPSRLLYFTRTVTQMNQVIEEIKRSAYNTKATILASRNHLCLNKEVMNGSAGGNIKTACFEKQKKNACKYKWQSYSIREKKDTENEKSEKNPGQENFLQGTSIVDIEDLRQIGSKCTVCPYYYAKAMANECEVVVMSYNYLTDRNCRQRIAGYIANSFIVFDEGHNLVRSLEDAKSWMFTQTEIANLPADLDSLKTELENKENNNSSEFFKMKYKKFQLVVRMIVDSMQKVFSLPKHPMFYKGETIVDFFCLKEFNESDFLENLGEVTKTIELKPSLMDFLRIYKELIAIYNKEIELFCYFKINISDEKSISFLCLEAAFGFKEILDFAPRTVLLASGTLTPFEVIENQLKVRFEKRIKISVDLEKWRPTFQTILVDSFYEFNRDQKINFKFKSRDSGENLNGVFSILKGVISKTPGGILVFLPSYAVLYEYEQYFRKQADLAKELERHKRLFFESKGKSSDAVFREYKNQCKGNGAVFFLVFGGKYSEGLDFKDELARLVMILGIPFKNINDVYTKAKKEYLEGKVRDFMGEYSLSFNDWYTKEALMLVNQAAGRVKRSEADYGLVMLVDERFKYRDNLSLLSEYVRMLSREFKSFEDLKGFLTGFYEENAKRTIALKMEAAKKPGELMLVSQKMEMKLEVEEKSRDVCVFCKELCKDPKRNICGHVGCYGCWVEEMENKMECGWCENRIMFGDLKSAN